MLMSTYTVNTFADTVAVDPSMSALDGDGNVSLRSAIQRTNMTSAADDIMLPAGRFVLSIRGLDGAAVGDLNIEGGSTTILGAGPGQTIIDGSSINNRIFHVHPGAQAVFGNLTIENADTTGLSNSGIDGGAIINGGDLALVNSVIQSSAADLGGGIFNAGGTVTVFNSTITGNTANEGGGIFNSAGTVSVNHSTIADNGSATGNGGGIFSFSGSVAITSSTFSGNTTFGPTSAGGGLFHAQGSVVITSSTFSGNSATDGGGILSSGGTLSLTGNTISGNTISGSGGGIYIQDTTVVMGNNIVAANFAAMSNDISVNNTTVSSAGSNLIGDGSGSTGLFNGVNGDMVGTAFNPIDPMLGALADNGGPTFTYALLEGSPAIDAGNNSLASAADQRLFPRNVGPNADIGAFEFNAPPVNLDVDGNGTVDALTDGILLARYLFGFSGNALVQNALGPGATRITSEDVAAFLNQATGPGSMGDPDGNGASDALTDGILTVRHMFGFSGSALVNDALGPDATRTVPVAIVTFLNQFRPPAEGPSQAPQSLQEESPESSAAALWDASTVAGLLASAQAGWRTSIAWPAAFADAADQEGDAAPPVSEVIQAWRDGSARLLTV